MTDDLVARLRLISAWKTPGGPMPTEDMVNPHITCAEAADRIEQLEAAYAQQQQVWSDAIARADRYEEALSRIYAWYPIK